MKKFTALVAFLLLSSWIFSQITVITTVITEPQCNGDCTGSANAVAIGGIAPYTYIWSTIPNQTGSVATGLCAGTYTVTAVDQTFSSGTGSATITEPAAIVITTSSIDASSCSTCDGEADASVSGGTTPYSYLWSDGQITATATGLCSGNYSVTVTDFNFCTDTANVTVNAVGGSGMTLTTTVNDATSSCFPCDGDAMVNVTGGTTPYTYQWNDFLSQTTQTATGLCPFTYSVTVTDNNGCSDSTNATVGSIGGSGMTLTGTSTDDTSGGCGTCNGTATLSVTGGVSPYSYQWPDGQTDSTATGLCTGDYTVSVTEANFCFDSLTITVNAGIGGGGITVTTSVTDASNPCFPCDGSATANATGGTTPYTYQWDDFNLQTTQTASALCPATYNVTVTDFTG
ncbi:hypothetical protein JYU20_04885, partial [Bacteroidales bacterium AH-315-I05]|nr:hypothetical protein [Bacteroidales bacterium AH-315-I05]